MTAFCGRANSTRGAPTTRPKPRPCSIPARVGSASRMKLPAATRRLARSPKSAPSVVPIGRDERDRPGRARRRRLARNDPHRRQARHRSDLQRVGGVSTRSSSSRTRPVSASRGCPVQATPGRTRSRTTSSSLTRQSPGCRARSRPVIASATTPRCWQGGGIPRLGAMAMPQARTCSGPGAIDTMIDPDSPRTNTS